MSAHNHSEEIGEYVPETYVPTAASHGTKELMKTFYILCVITVIDFIIYFTWPSGWDLMGRNITFIALGIVKAFFIVGTFMHLKHEKMFFILMLIIPAIAFLGMLIFGLLHEGNALSTY